MRDLPAQIASEIVSPAVMPALLAEMYFDSGPLYMWTGIGELIWSGKTYIGGGNLVSISPIQETQELQAKGLVCTLNGIPSNLIATVLSEKSRGRSFKLYFSTISLQGYILQEDGSYILQETGGSAILTEANIVTTPYRIYTGLMDVMEFSDNGETATIALSVESAMIIGEREKKTRYTAEDQKRLYPNDKGLDNISQLQDKEVIW
jgi:hypothetical protein